MSQVLRLNYGLSKPKGQQEDLDEGYWDMVLGSGESGPESGLGIFIEVWDWTGEYKKTERRAWMNEEFVKALGVL